MKLLTFIMALLWPYHTRNFCFQKKILVFNIFFSFLLMSSMANAQSLEITSSTNKGDVLTCEPLIFTLKYKCASTTNNCTGVTMSANIPSGIFFQLQNIGLTSDIASYSISTDRRTINFVFKEPLLAGNTGIIEIPAEAECGLADATLATLTAKILTGSTVSATSTTNVTLHSSNQFCSQTSTPMGLAVDNSTYYTIDLKYPKNYGENGIGATSAGPVTLVDQFPSGAIINAVSATMIDGTSPLQTIPPNTCVIDNALSKVTCTFPPTVFQVTSRYAPRVIIKIDVKYPSTIFNVNDNVTNAVTVTHQPVGSSSPITLVDGSVVNYNSGNSFAVPNPTSCTAKLSTSNQLQEPLSALRPMKFGDTQLQSGSNGKYTFHAQNIGNTTLENIILEDIIPSEITVNSISGFSKENLIGNETISIWVKTSSNPTYTQITIPGQYVPYTVPTGERITAIKAVISSLPAGSRVYDMYINFITNNITTTSVQNCLTAITSTTGAVISPDNLCVTSSVLPLNSFSTLQINKWLTIAPLSQYASYYNGTVNIGATVWSTLYFANKGGGQSLEKPVIMDLLPIGLTYQNEVQYGSSSCSFPSADSVIVIPNYNGSGRTLVRLVWNTALPSNCDKWVSIKTSVNTLGIAGTKDLYTHNQLVYDDPYANLKGAKNTAFFSGKSISKCYQQSIYENIDKYQVADIYDLDADGKKTNDTLCFASDYVGITALAQLSSVKWVKGQCDTTYTKYPNFGKTMPGGIANYKLIITNTGNVPTSSIEILDILPYVGDIGVIDTQPRATQWRPNLVTPLHTPTGITVYYTTVQNPCRVGYIQSGPTGCNQPNWTTVLPADPTTVQALKFDFGTKILNPGDEVELSWDMRAPANAPSNSEIAWNSFGFKASRADNNDPFLSTEPNKVGIQIKPLVTGAYGNKVWLDQNKNGIQDANETGVDGVRVELHKDNGDGIADPKNDELVNYTSTGNNGLYLFPNLPTGNYYAVFFLPVGFSGSTPNVSTPLDSLDSDGISGLCNGQRVTITEITNITSTEMDLSWDQGVFSDKAAVGNYVWFDENKNNIQDESTSNGVNGVIVSLYKDNGNGIAEPGAADGSPIAKDTTTTDIYGRPGYYLFENLEAGNYFVKFNLTNGQQFTTASGTINGNSDETDSDANQQGLTEVFTLTTGEGDLTWDAGLIISKGSYSLGNLVWNDANNNGLVDVSEKGINGVSVVLYQDSNNNSLPDTDEYLSTTVTNTVGGVAGIYTFENLLSANYIVQISSTNFSNQLKDFISSTGNDPASDPDNDLENDDNGFLSQSYTIISKPISLGDSAEPTRLGVENLTLDFGFYKCEKPNFLINLIPPVCNGSNGKITISNGSIGDKVGFSIGNTYTGDNYQNARLISSLTNGVVIDNVINPQSDFNYTLRVFNGNDLCYEDIIVHISKIECCTAVTDLSASANNPILIGGSINLSATSTIATRYEWKGPNAFSSSIQNSIITNATEQMNGVYTITAYSGTTCSATATVSVSIIPPPVDLSLHKYTINEKCKYAFGDTVVFKILLKRDDSAPIIVDGISIKDSLSPQFSFVSAKVSKGTYSINTNIWSGIAMASSDTAILEIKAVLRANTGVLGGLFCHEAWIQTFNGTDTDSRAGDKAIEDDFIRTCVSVPVRICKIRNEKVDLVAPSGYSSYQWYDTNGNPILGATNAILSVSEAGSYSVKVDGNNCPNNSCCPIYVEEFCECPSKICIPFVVKKINK